MIEIYTKNNCGACSEAKQILDNRGMIYSQYVLDEHISKEQLLAKFPDVRTVPVIVVDGKRVGGLSDLKVFLESNGNGEKTLLQE